jgi:hypothetical protein
MRLQLSVLGARPMNTQQQAPFTPTNNKSKVNNSTHALAQRQGLTELALGKLQESYEEYIGSLITDYIQSHNTGQRIKLLAYISDYYVRCLRDPEWAKLTKDEKITHCIENIMDGLLADISLLFAPGFAYNLRQEASIYLSRAVESYTENPPTPEQITELIKKFQGFSATYRSKHFYIF